MFDCLWSFLYIVNINLFVRFIGVKYIDPFVKLCIGLIKVRVESVWHSVGQCFVKRNLKHLKASFCYHFDTIVRKSTLQSPSQFYFQIFLRDKVLNLNSGIAEESFDYLFFFEFPSQTNENKCKFIVKEHFQRRPPQFTF